MHLVVLKCLRVMELATASLLSFHGEPYNAETYREGKDGITKKAALEERGSACLYVL